MVDKDKGWWISNKSSSKYNLINFINLLVMLFNLILPINEINIRQLNKNKKSKYSLVDSILTKNIYFNLA